MATTDPDVEDLASVCEGLAHAYRWAILFALRKEKKMPLADLRKRVGELYLDLDTSNLQFHLRKMQMGGIVTTAKEQGREVVTLLKDVTIREKAA